MINDEGFLKKMIKGGIAVIMNRRGIEDIPIRKLKKKPQSGLLVDPQGKFI